MRLRHRYVQVRPGDPLTDGARFTRVQSLYGVHDMSGRCNLLVSFQ